MAYMRRGSPQRLSYTEAQCISLRPENAHNLRPGIAPESPHTRAAYFGFLVYGIDLFCFSLFLPLVFRFEVVPVGALLYHTQIRS